MMRRGFAIPRLVGGLTALSLLALAGCQPGARPIASTGTITPFEAIQAAAAAAPRRVPGVFEIRVAASGRQSGNIYLNSEKDYRDQRNLTVAIHPSAFTALRARFGGDPDEALAGKVIRVKGAARRAQILFLEDGRPTGKYYYQTHVDVVRGDQIEIAG